MADPERRPASAKPITETPAQTPEFSEVLRVFARIGLLSFGGPAGQIAMLHKAVVEERQWLSEERFLHALSYCMLLPGPEAQQLATYIGWLVKGVRGGILAGLLFVLPGLAVMIGLSTAYALYQQTDWLTGLFFGLKAAVLAIVVQALVRLSVRTLKSGFHIALAVGAFLALFVLDLPFPLVVLGAGLLGYWRSRFTAPVSPSIDAGVGRPALTSQLLSLLFWIVIWQLPLLILWLVDGFEPLATLFGFFSRMALVTFGGAYAVLAYVAQVVVQDYGWLRPGEMVDGLALAETTPGPLVLVLSHIGYLVGFRTVNGIDPVIGGILGALLAAWATFVPSFIWIFAGAPYIERLRGNARMSAALSAITAAVVGVICNLALWFGLHVLFREMHRIPLLPPIPGKNTSGLLVPVLSSLDLAALALFLVSAFLLIRMQAGMVKVLAFCALAGVIWQVFTG